MMPNFIEPSVSPWAHRIVPIEKKDGTLRVCIDYRPVNEVTIGDAYPSTDPSFILDHLAGRHVFTKLDAEKGYYQVNLDISSRPLTAFTSPIGLFQFKVLPFGLKNAVAYFQRMMNNILAHTLNKTNFVLLDDILTASPSYQEHLIHLRETLSLLRAKGVCLNLSKCEFALLCLTYLGFVIDETGLHADPHKITAIQNWSVPKTKKDVRSFVGAINYLRRFIPNCAHYTSCLADLTSDLITS